MPWWFLLAYTCSGMAGLVYEVSWTRLLTLYIGHSTAAAAAVVGAFLGGLALGAAWGGDLASRWTRRRALQGYVALEVAVAAAALALPVVLRALTPLLSWAYGSDGSGLLFPAVRLGTCLVLVLVPAAALGATFPMAIRWFASETKRPAHGSGILYALNTAGAAVGALLAGFLLIPTIGISGTTLVGVGGSLLAAAAVAWRLLQPALPTGDNPLLQTERSSPSSLRTKSAAGRRRKANALAAADPAEGATAPGARRIAAAVLGVSGFASLVHEIAWTRILALVLGPTTYAFAAALAAVIAGVAIGSAAGSWLAGRARQPATWLATTLALGAMTTSYTYSLAGERFPALVARQMAGSDDPFGQLLRQGLLLTAALIVPTAACLGAAFPLALALSGHQGGPVTRRFGIVYATNTIGAVAGSLAAGFVLIPRLGLQLTLQLVCALLVGAALIVLLLAARAWSHRTPGLLASAAALGLLVASPPWDRELLASGPYMYAPFVPPDLDLTTQLKAGTLLYYREGASATVSVKRLTGTTTLAVDGKVDASNRGDMLTQKLIAHLPLLVHEQPAQVAIVGLGSGVTAGAALVHPVTRVDVIEISPEVVEASAHFTAENRAALEDPRLRLIVGDGRTHLQLAREPYDVIVSEPSNPWIAGVAALFTREFFEAVRARLAPGGVFCQWANAYNISEPDLRSIVATFQAVFPQGTVWLVGNDDVLMLTSDGPLESRLARLADHIERPGVGADLASVGARDAFSILSLFVAGPAAIAQYSAGAPLLSDDTMRLEFSTPRELHNRRAGDNVAALIAAGTESAVPPIVHDARASAGAVEWRNRGAMFAKADVFGRANEDFLVALRHDPSDPEALEGLVSTALVTGRSADVLVKLREQFEPAVLDRPRMLVAMSKLQAAAGQRDDALASARRATEVDRQDPAGHEQLASLHADAGDTVRLDQEVDALQHFSGDKAAATLYYAAAAQLLHGNLPLAMVLAERGVGLHPTHAPLYDLVGAIYTKRGEVYRARWAFEQSLKFDPHDSTAYENLGLLALAEGDLATARNYFAEALWLVPSSRVAREGMARTR